MNKVNISIWGREFDLDITYDCYSGEEILESQKDAVEQFTHADLAIMESLEDVKKYCLAENGEEIGTDAIENIFKYVMPKYLYIVRSEAKRVVSIMCNYRFDPENGIAVVFEDEKFSKIGKQDIIL